MLNNLTNFFSIIVGKRIKKRLEPSDLIAIGTKQSSQLGDYKSTAIQFSDLQEQLKGLQTVSVDGVTITGDGTSSNPLIASIPSSSVNYSNVIFVDPINGNNLTGIAGDVNKPFLTPFAAATAASAIARTVNNRVLIWIRKGEYVNGSFLPYTNMDVYCEPGVVFTGSFSISDINIQEPVNFNIYGYAKWVLSQTTFLFRWDFASTVYIQGNSIVNLGAISIAINVTSGTSNITYDFNSIESTQTLGNGYAFSWRNNCNGTVNVKDYIKSPHSHHDVRAGHTGTINVNCPNNILTATNIYGGNFKQIVYASNVFSASIININGNLINEGLTYLGGLEGMVLCQSGTPLITINGNITSPAGIGVNGRSSEIVVVNGSITAGIYAAYQITGAGESYFNNGTYRNITQSPVFVVSGTKQLFIRNASIYNGSDITSGVDILSNTAKLYMYNCISTRFLNTVGFLAFGSVAGTVVQLHNVRSSAGLHPNVTDQLSPTGLIVDPLLIVPKY
jgi:hypothetical protein